MSPTDAAAAAGGGLRRWWRGAGPFSRVTVVVVALALGVNVLLAGLNMAVGSDPGGADGSSYATGASGVAAWAELLARQGRDVERLRVPLSDAKVAADATIVVVEPDPAPTAADLGALAEHLSAGGRVVVVGQAGADLVAGLTGVDPGWSTGGGPDVDVSPGALGAARTLRTRGFGQFLTAGGTDVLAGDDRSAAVVAAGPLVAVADLSIVSNRGLAQGDNAAAALALGGDGPVVFAEELHGYGEASGPAALPSHWKQAGAGLAVAVVLLMWSVGHRLGPADRTRRDLPPPRRAYVDAVAASIARQGPLQEDPRRGPR